MTCNIKSIKKNQTSDLMKQRGEGNTFVRAELDGCDKEAVVDVFEHGGKTCVSVISKDLKQETKACI